MKFMMICKTILATMPFMANDVVKMYVMKR